MHRRRERLAVESRRHGTAGELDGQVLRLAQGAHVEADTELGARGGPHFRGMLVQPVRDEVQAQIGHVPWDARRAERGRAAVQARGVWHGVSIGGVGAEGVSLGQFR